MKFHAYDFKKPIKLRLLRPIVKYAKQLYKYISHPIPKSAGHFPEKHLTPYSEKCQSFPRKNLTPYSEMCESFPRKTSHTIFRKVPVIFPKNISHPIPKSASHSPDRGLHEEEGQFKTSRKKVHHTQSCAPRTGRRRGEGYLSLNKSKVHPVITTTAPCSEQLFGFLRQIFGHRIPNSAFWLELGTSLYFVMLLQHDLASISNKKK
jgi:hypothetical protein